MADQLNMNGLSLNDSKHANGGLGGMGTGRSTYIPPHMRGQPAAGGPPPMMDGPAPGEAAAWGNNVYVKNSQDTIKIY